MSGKSVLWVSLALLVWSGVGPAAEIHPNLVGWWRLDETAGTTANDTSGRSVAGELFGDPTWSADGVHGGSLLFDGVDDYVFIDGFFKLPLYTMTVWFRVDGGTGGRDIVSAYAIGVQHGILLELRDDGTLRYLHRYPLGTGGGTNIYTTETYDDGAWYYAAFVKAEDEIRLYVNGEEVGTAPDTSVFDPTDAFGVALGVLDEERGAARLFVGPLDDVRIYDRVLTVEEIQTVMDGDVYPFAVGLTPNDGAVVDSSFVTLRWMPGDLADSHRVYFGEDFDAVNEGQVEPIAMAGELLIVGTQPPYEGGLTPGKTYYWRVDEIAEGNPDSPWKGDVWSFTVQPQVAWRPSPVDGGTFVGPDQDLSWEAGRGVLFHTVYFGETFDEISTAVAGGWMQVDPIYDPGPLEPGKTYYWRVDEFATTGSHKGDVWSFATVPVIPPADDPNLILWWTLDEGPGASAPVDWSGRGHHATMMDDPTWTLDGYDGGALEFDAKRDYIYTELAPAMPSQTVCAWVKIDGIPTSILGWADDHPTAGSHDRNLYVDPAGQLNWRVWTGAATILTAGARVDDGNWHHVAGVYTDGGDSELYVDGTRESWAAVSDVHDGYTTPHLTVGIESQQNKYLPGAVDDVRVYDKALNEDEVAQIMRGDPLLAWGPEPGRNAIVDIRDVTSLRWNAGDGAASHDVYLGNDRDAVTAANKDSAQYQGNVVATSLPLAGLVEFGGGDYFWRVDEVEADGTVHAGRIWTFNVPDYLVIDDFEGYSNEVGERPFEVWIDGIGFSLPDPGNPGNGTTAAVGHDVWSPTSPYYNGQIMETALVNSGGQSMPIDFNNVFSPYYGEAGRTWTTPQNWTLHGVDTLTLYVRGRTTNTPDSLYVALEDNAGRVVVAAHPDPDVLLTTSWTPWDIPLNRFTAGGVDVAAVKTMYLGFGNRDNPVPGGGGTVYFDDVRITLSAGQ